MQNGPLTRSRHHPLLARRYALFVLIGIADEEDVDALISWPSRASHKAGQIFQSDRRSANGKRAKVAR